MADSNPNLDLVNINAFTKFGEILSNSSPDIEWKRNSDINQGQLLCYKIAKKTTTEANNPIVDRAIINAYITFGEMLSICSQDTRIERK